jgi:hypothetical protein
MAGVRDYLNQIKGNTPVAAGISEVLFAADRDELLAAIERCPDLLTDKGAAGFELVATMAAVMGGPRVTEAIRQRKATVEAIREARE